MHGLPFQIGVLVDGDIDLDCVKVLSVMDGVLKQLQQFLPHTPVELLMLLANANEQQFADQAANRNVRIRHIEGDPNGRGIAWLCSHCSLVVAVSAHTVGGRAGQALDFRMHSIPPELGGSRGFFFAPETGPVLLLQVPGVAPGVADVLKDITFPHGQSFKKLQRQMHELDLANAAVTRLGQYRDVRSISDMPDDSDQADLVHAFQVVDTLSRRQQQRVTLLHGGMLLVGFIAVLSMQLIGMFVSGLPMADVYAVVFMLLGLGHMAVRNLEATDQYADYRVLAECLRVQYFWRKAGISAAPANFFLHKHVHRLAWVREAVKAFHLQTELPAAKSQSVLAPWVLSQLRYHTGSARRNGALYRRLERGVWCLYLSSAVLTALVFSAPSHFATNVWIGATLGVTASCGTLLLIFNGSMGFGSRAAQHQRMSESFALAANLLSGVGHENECYELLVDLGRESIQETSEWIFVQGPP